MAYIGSGGQSALVGYEKLPTRFAGTQAMPLLVPPMQVPAEQIGQG
jgi:hypothetical protein